MGFGQEFKNMRSQGGSPKASEEAVKAADAEVAASAESSQGEANTDAETYSNPFVDGHTIGEEEKTAELVIPPPKVEAKKVGVKINGKHFDSIEEATDYAAKLEIELEKKEAVEKYIESTKTKADVTPAEEKKIRKIAGKIFENPEEAFEELEGYILELAEKKAEERDSKKTDAQLKADQMKRDVDSFYEANADLADWQDEVNLVVIRNEKALMSLPKEQIANEVARLAREYVSSIKERALPRQALPSKTVQNPGQGLKSTTATSQPATKKDISFAAQVRSTNKRTALQNEA